MNRIRHISLIFVVFFCFSVMPVFSSTGGSAPKLQFTKWQAGQGQEYTTLNPPHTFITDTETTCEITATVAYASSQPSSVSPLTDYTWEVRGSHGCMKTHLLGWVPIALFFVVATLSVRQHLRDAAQTLCRPIPNLCQPYTQSPPCEYLCPDACRR